MYVSKEFIEENAGFRPAAYIFIFKGPNLIVGKKKGEDYYSLPGGKLETGETPEDGALRETLEEVGIAVTKLKSLGYPTIIRFDTLSWGNYIGSINHFFRAEFDRIEETSLGQGPEGALERIEISPSDYIKHLDRRINDTEYYGQKVFFQTQKDLLKKL
ncbi:MAG: NUDIX hydrolase [Candidatus Peribacteraceae bacterium]|nr:NUDIX hydrolase [Candidatus Peribacteraceae bacterium]